MEANFDTQTNMFGDNMFGETKRNVTITTTTNCGSATSPDGMPSVSIPVPGGDSKTHGLASD